MDDVPLRQRVCRTCGTQFAICRSCDRGHAYCAPRCRVAARRRTITAARTRHRRSPEGRLDHRDHQRAYRARARDQTSHRPVPPGTLAPDTSTDRSPTAPLMGAGRCVVCGRESAWLLPQPWPVRRVSLEEQGGLDRDRRRSFRSGGYECRDRCGTPTHGARASGKSGGHHTSVPGTSDAVAPGPESAGSRCNAGSFVHTLVLTDVSSGWTECVALVVRDSTLIVEALTRLRATLPFRLLGFDTDNGSECLNETVLAYCAAQQIEFTRSRPYRKNDQAWVEQKNGAVVRRLVGHRRFEGLAAAEALTRLYAASRLFTNFFQPSFKLADKTRAGARVTKRYHAPATPCARLLASETIAEPVKDRLRGVATTLDPLRLLDEIRTMQHHLAALASGGTPHVAAHREADLDEFLRGLATAWRDGEVRPTHQTSPKPRRDWRTRADPFDAVWPQLRGWLAVAPDRTAIDLLTQLQQENPGAFPDTQLRTLQRRVKAWRTGHARETSSMIAA